jgi:tetratricopeptide (TPR) repeat protein
MASTARLDELKKKFDENPRRYFAPLANEHRKSGDLDQAIALCRTHLPQQPAHISGHIVLAQALYEAGSLDESRDIFHAALGLDPENLIALRYLGDIARDSADIDTARSWYQRVLEVDPRNDEIVQLVRELDSPRQPEPVVAAESTAPVAPPVAEVASAPEPVTAEPEKTPADDRFAPLSLEELDIDAAAPRAEAATEQAAGDPMLDTPGIDPFEMPEGASADALFDMATQESSPDYFLEAFAETSGSADVASEPELLDASEWASAPEPDSSAPEPTPAAAPVAELDVADFEAGEFYVEPAPEAPAPGDVVEEPDLSMGWSLASETPDSPRPVYDGVQSQSAPEPVAEVPAAPEPELQVAPAAELEQVGQVESVAEISEIGAVSDVPDVSEIAMIADAPTAEWNAAEMQTLMPAAETPAAPASGELGLESMEFVPPTSLTPASVAAVPSPNADPLIGSTPVIAAAASGTPAAFVTETMAELYLQQGFRNEALAVYRELLSRNPNDASLRERIEKIESGSMSSIGMAMVSENVVESAIRRQSAKPAKSVRSFFAALASRRAPAPREVPVADLAPDPATDEPVAALEAAAQPVDATESSHINPMMSAAETLASFDPFAEEPVAESDIDIPAPELLPNEPPAVSESPMFASAPERPQPITPEPVGELSPRPLSTQPEAPARTSLEDLFPDTPVTPRSEAAANTLATAFGRPEPQGRPTRAASSELSLDKVFRGSSEGAPPTDGGFSFDQFFSDSRSGSDVAAAPTVSPPDTGRSAGGAGDAHDIEQFTAWLEGLKKK